jgi:hypothetical protein
MKASDALSSRLAKPIPRMARRFLTASIRFGVPTEGLPYLLARLCPSHAIYGRYGRSRP